MSQPVAILNVEDDDDDAAILAHALSAVPGREYRLHRTTSLAQMPQAIASAKPDLILLDLNLPDGRGTDTIVAGLRHAGEIPVLVLTGNGTDHIGQSSIEAGVQDFIPKAELMSAALQRAIDYAIRRKRLQCNAERRGLTDPLTGLFNRASLNQHLAAATARVARHGGGFAIAFVDLDGFKAINDKFGHEAGDKVLVEVARRTQAVARTNDCLHRLGGDEFVLYLDGVKTRAKARQAATRYAASIERPVTLDVASNSERVSVAASIGLAICPEDSLDANELIAIADQAMYDRKRSKAELGARSAATLSVPTRPSLTEY